MEDQAAVASDVAVPDLVNAVNIDKEEMEDKKVTSLTDEISVTISSSTQDAIPAVSENVVRSGEVATTASEEVITSASEEVTYVVPEGAIPAPPVIIDWPAEEEVTNGDQVAPVVEVIPSTSTSEILNGIQQLFDDQSLTSSINPFLQEAKNAMPWLEELYQKYSKCEKPKNSIISIIRGLNIVIDRLTDPNLKTIGLQFVPNIIEYVSLIMECALEFDKWTLAQITANGSYEISVNVQLMTLSFAANSLKSTAERISATRGPTGPIILNGTFEEITSLLGHFYDEVEFYNKVSRVLDVVENENSFVTKRFSDYNTIYRGFMLKLRPSVIVNFNDLTDDPLYTYVLHFYLEKVRRIKQSKQRAEAAAAAAAAATVTRGEVKKTNPELKRRAEEDNAVAEKPKENQETGKVQEDDVVSTPEPADKRICLEGEPSAI